MRIALTSNDLALGLRLPDGAGDMTFWDHGHPDSVMGFARRAR
jgi:hypothetical protein